MCAATGAGTASSTSEKHPAASSARESDSSASAFSAERPCALYPPSIVADWGVSPRCPITGMPAATMLWTRESIAPAPSSLTASAPASLTKRMALRIASSSETWNDPKGMSAMTSGRLAPRVTARVRISISSIVAGTVDSWPSTVIAAESPTRTRSAPAWSASRPPGASYAVTITIGCRRAFISASSVSGSFPGAGVAGAGFWGRMLTSCLLPEGRCR